MFLWRSLTLQGKLALLLTFGLASLIAWFLYTSLSEDDAVGRAVAPITFEPPPVLIPAIRATPALDSDRTTATPEPATGTPEPATGTPAPPVVTREADLSVGRPLTAARVLEAWATAGLAVDMIETSVSFGRVQASVFRVLLIKGDGRAEVALLVYQTREDALRDWTLVPSRKPEPRSGLNLPPHETMWWNQNVVAVVEQRSGDISKAALDAFLQLRP